MLKTLLKLVMGLGLAVIGWAQAPLKLVDGNGNELVLAKGGKSFTYYLTAMTTGATTITSVNTNVQLLFCANSSGSAVTITVTDAQGSPVTYFSTVSLAANSVVLMHASTVGLYMQGIKITASANSAISCQVQGVQ